MFVCIECSSEVENLYTEYSGHNVKLSRCPSCSAVCDKYIEYDAILVFLDVVLHRKEAYRHYLWNRPKINLQKDAKRLCLAVVISGSVMKGLALASDATVPFFVNAAATTITEHMVFILTVFSLFRCAYVDAGSVPRREFERLYVVLAFPELFKLLAVMLHIWDAEPVVSAMYSIVILSVQHQSYNLFVELLQKRTRTSMSYYVKFIPAHILVAAVARATIRYLLLSPEEGYKLGLIL